MCLARPSWVTVSKWERSLPTFGGKLEGSDLESQQHYFEESWKDQNAEEVNLNSGRESWKIWKGWWVILAEPRLGSNFAEGDNLKVKRWKKNFTW